MKLMMYPKTSYEELKARFGMEGIEPPYILQHLGQDNPNYTILTLVINVSYPNDIIGGGRYLNPRILRMLDKCFEKLDFCVVHLGNYPETTNDERPNLILPVIKCEWLHDIYEYGIYLLVDNKGNKHGELRFWNMSAYYGDFYGEDAAVFVALPEEQSFRLKNLLQQHCEQEHIGFTEYPEVQYKKIPYSFGERIFASISKFFKSNN